MKRRNWTDLEIDFLKGQSLSVIECAIKFNRRPSVVSAKVSLLGLNMPRKKPVRSDVKICCSCGVSKPRTDEYFFKKKVFNRSKTREYWSFRSNCKKCHGKKGTEKKRLKKIIEYGCSKEDYETVWRKKTGESNRKYPYLWNSDIPDKDRRSLYRLINNGYVFVSYEKYKEDKKEIRREHNKRNSKFKDIPDGFYKWSEVPKNIKNKILITREPSDSKLSNWLGYKVGEVPKEVLDVKRIIYKITREIQNQQ